MLARARHELAADRGLALRARDVVDLRADRLTRARIATRRDPGEHSLEHGVGQRIPRGEVRIAHKLDLALAVGGASARALDRHAPPAERHLSILMAVAHRGPAKVVLALRADDLVDLGLHQLVQHPEPDADAQREQPFLGGAGELAERLLHRARQLLDALLAGRDRRSRYGPHGGWSSCPRGLRFALATVPTGPDEAGGPPPQVLRATGQAPVDSAARQVDFLDAEIAEVEQLIAAEALSWPQVKRLMTVPGVNVIVAATFMAAVGDIARFPDRRKLTAYLGLDPRVRRSGAAPAAHGHISKQVSSSARHALVEACSSTVRQPGPIAGFYQRVKARRGHSIAIIASARKLGVCSDVCSDAGRGCGSPRPSLTKKKMRRLELQAGARRWQGGRGIWTTDEAMREAERGLALQAQRAYDGRQRLATRQGREHDTGPRIHGSSKEHVAAGLEAQVCALMVVARAHPKSPTTGGHRSNRT